MTWCSSGSTQVDTARGHCSKIKRLVGALGIIFVLMTTCIRQTAPPSDLGQRRVTDGRRAARIPYAYVVCHRYEDCVNSLDTGFN